MGFKSDFNKMKAQFTKDVKIVGKKLVDAGIIDDADEIVIENHTSFHAADAATIKKYIVQVSASVLINSHTEIIKVPVSNFAFLLNKFESVAKVSALLEEFSLSSDLLEEAVEATDDEDDDEDEAAADAGAGATGAAAAPAGGGIPPTRE